MANFFVGQKVRIVRAKYPENLGKTAVIDGFLTHAGRPAAAITKCLSGPGKWSYLADLEPILDRHEPCEAEFKESLDELLSRENNNETVK